MLAAFAVVLTTAGTATAQRTPGVDCVPVRVKSCALPFPSDHWEAPDPTSPTGVSARVPDGIMDADFLTQVPSSLQPQELFRGATGYSAAGPVLFEFDGPVLPTTFGRDGRARDGRATVVVFDRVTGARVPVQTEVDMQGFGHPAQAHIIRIWPQTRFAFGHRHTAVVTRGVRRLGGAAFSPAPGVPAAAAAEADFLRSNGIDPADVLSITSWTVRDEQNAIGPLVDAVATAYAADHPAEITGAMPGFFPGIGALLKGRVLVTDLRTSPDGGFATTTATAPGAKWVDFWLSVPWSAAGARAPVAVYGHGLTVSKETFLVAAIQNARFGIATIAMDQPNHGERAETEGYLKFLTSPDQTARLAAIPAQSAVDQTSLVKALKTSLRDVDALPWSWFPLLPPPPGTTPGASGDGLADLDPDRLILQGTSLGGVLGGTALAVVPGIDAGFLTVGGVGIMRILTGSSMWNGLEFWRMIPDGGTGADAALAVAAIQQRMDVGDPVNFVHRWSSPTTGEAARPVTFVSAIGDGIVSSDTANALASIAQLGQIGPVQQRLDGLPVVDGSSGSGYLQIPDDAPPFLFGGLRGWLQHIAFFRPEAQELGDRWLATWVTGGFARP